ncbi:restriction endonuclease subunit S [Pseudoalteromonas sp. 1CM17D]|uniref:restriction endonuclease subunit S n=1 Tax=Pseudoalteromonas sp. 1CM17D TaxID=2929162 RepID=UPI0020C02FC9|nr:restriction endonuclease subunit S [Pseudoalteromonas sp. 1CM17D]MCK8095034.1 restriction endonuclease subunit S [Pseudoalteromonas sp. 1CM17D]
MTGTTLSGRKYKAYPEYKESGVEWLPELPANWKIERTKRMFSLKRCLVGNQSSNYQLLSLTLKGVIPRDISSGEGKIPESFDTYQKVDENDLIFCLFDIDETPRTIGISPLNGMITGAYNVYGCLEHCYSDYAYYYFFHIDSFKGLKPFYTGLRKVVRAETFSNIEMPCPSFEEQQKIASFLDHETAKIDTLIAKQEKLIELLKEKRQAVISHAVTKGLNPNAPMRDSGVEWLGEVPEHWRVAKLSYFLKLLSGDGITSNQIEPVGKYPVMGGNGLRGYTTNYNCNGEYALIGRQGALCGNVNIAKGKFFASEHAVVVYPYLDFNLTFLSEFLRFMNLGQYSVSAAQPGISVERVNALKIAIPPLTEQTDIGDKIKVNTCRFDTLTSRAKTMIEVLKERKAALISAAVTGKIDVRDWKSQGI